MQKKVLAYLTRKSPSGKTEMLVFRLRGCPEAGIMVPGDIVEVGEKEEETLYREIEDRSGLIHLRFIGKVDSYLHHKGSIRNSEERHIFQVESLESPPNYWSHEQDVFDEDPKPICDFFWIALDKAEDILTDEQGKSAYRLLPNPMGSHS